MSQPIIHLSSHHVQINENIQLLLDKQFATLARHHPLVREIYVTLKMETHGHHRKEFTATGRIHHQGKTVTSGQNHHDLHQAIHQLAHTLDHEIEKEKFRDPFQPGTRPHQTA